MDATERAVVRWIFKRHPDGRWSWVRSTMGESSSQTSELCDDFGKVMAHAIRHGFDSRQHIWIVENQGWLTTYRPGEPTLHEPMVVINDLAGKAESGNDGRAP